MSRVSIIIPCFNDGKYINQAVESAKRQTHQDLEIIIVNDGSTDKYTLTVLQQISSNNIRIINTSNQGVSAARNAGIRMATGRYILPLDADDCIAPSYAEHASAVLDENMRIGIVGGHIEYFGITHAPGRPTYDGVASMLTSNRLFICSMFRRADWAATDGYPEQLAIGEDWIFWLRLLAGGCDVAILDEIVWYYRQRASQATRKIQIGDQRRALMFAMRDQPLLYSENFQSIVDYLDTKLSVLDSYRKRFGLVMSTEATVRKALGHFRRAIMTISECLRSER